MEMTKDIVDLYCPYCGARGLKRWDGWDCPDGHDWFECPHCGESFSIITKV